MILGCIADDLAALFIKILTFVDQLLTRIYQVIRNFFSLAP